MFAADSKVAPGSIIVPLTAEPASAWKQITEPIEPFLEAVNRRLAQQVESFDREIAPYAEYALNGHGKHLRPALVALTGNALGKIGDSHVTVAVIIEMVHLATLVHDDVVDEAQLRRGLPTLAANWGNEIAVLFGDCLFAQALKLAASFPTPEICRSVAMATNTVCSGEILQTRHRRDFGFTREEYFKVLEMKTAELFALSCELSACLSGTSAENRARLRQFGLALGTAYQIYDDCVDLFGSEAVAGKSLGTDLAKGKLTLPALLFLERAEAAERATLQKWVGNGQPPSVKDVTKLMARHNVLEESLEFAHQYLDQARQSAQGLPESEGRSGLLGIAEYLGHQTDRLGGCS